MATAQDEIAAVMAEDLQTRASSEGLGVFQQGDFAEMTQFIHGGVTLTSNTVTETTVYDTSSGEPRTFPLAYLAKTLRKMRGGKRAFVAADPETGLPLSPVPVYRKGTLMCFLHPDHPDRAELEKMGIGRDLICGDHTTAPAASFRSEFDLRNHEERRHPRSWKIREEGRAKAEREAEREEQRQHTAAILALAGGNAALSSSVSIHPCDASDCTRFFDSAQGLKLHQAKEHK